MHVDITFVLMTFIVILAVVCLSDSLVTAMLLISLLINILVMTGYDIKQHMVADPANDKSEENNSKSAPAADELSNTTAPDFMPQDIYGPHYEAWHGYQTGYSTCYNQPQLPAGVSMSERSRSVDAAGALMAQNRTRDRKAMDGYTCKDTNYYKYHYADELAHEEKKIWWNAQEY